MRRLAYVLAVLVCTLVSQIAVFWATVALVQSPALDRFRDLGPGSVSEAVLLLVLILTFDAVLVVLLALAIRRHRRKSPG